MMLRPYLKYISVWAARVEKREMSIRFEVHGLQEALRSLGNISRDLPIVKHATLQEAARFMVNEGKRNVHRISGDLYRSIGIEPGSPSPDHVVVSAKMPYATVENKRKGEKVSYKGSIPPYGPHNYFDRAVTTTSTEFKSRIIANINSLLQRNRSSGTFFP